MRGNTFPQATAHPNSVCLCCCVNGAAMAHYIDYDAETYGIYLALATDANVPVGACSKALSRYAFSCCPFGFNWGTSFRGSIATQHASSQ